MRTREGIVEVDREELERVARSTSTDGIGIDRPTPPKMRREVLMRDGNLCANPCCFRAARHGHHIEYRSLGGRTELENLVAVCAMSATR